MAQLTKSSVKRDYLPRDVIFEGWIEASTSRDVSKLQMAYWRLSRAAISLFQNGVDPKAVPILEILLDQVVQVEQEGQDSPFFFIIRAVGLVIYIGRRQFVQRQPSEIALLPQTQEQQLQYYTEWMSRLRTVWIPRIQNDFNIHELYDLTNEVLGQGQYGIVYTAKQKATGELIALKAIDYSMANFKQLNPETRIPKVLNHPGVIKIIGLYYSREKIYIATEKLHGDLLGFILNQPTRRLDERTTKFISYQIISAVAFLNNFDVVHCDIKPENVLLTENHPFPQIKLCDFGYSRILNKGSVRRGSFVGTMNYLPPEAICRVPIFNTSLDTWACGVVIYVSLTGVFPYNPSEDIKTQVGEDRVFFAPTAWATTSQEARDIVRRMMALSARNRGDCKGFKHHPWFMNDYQFWCDLKAFEEQRAKAPSTNGSVEKRRWWTDDLGLDEVMEKRQQEKRLPHWSQIGCVRQGQPPPQPQPQPQKSAVTPPTNDQQPMEDQF